MPIVPGTPRKEEKNKVIIFIGTLNPIYPWKIFKIARRTTPETAESTINLGPLLIRKTSQNSEVITSAVNKE